MEFAGAQLIFKASLAAVIIILAAVVYRPFCRVLCPLGAFYSLFNGVAFVRFRCDKDKCTSCGSCSRACRIQLDPAAQPNSPECVRCGACVSACGENALSYGVSKIEATERNA